MTKAPHPARPRSPVQEVAFAQAFHAGLGHDVRHFQALWHSFNVGHMLTTDLDRICRGYDLSIADFNLLGALRIERSQPLRPTDLAITLQVSNSALTARIARLAEKELLTKSPVADDRRAFILELTPEGATRVDAIHCSLSQDSHFVREVRRLSEPDRAALERIMGELHGRLIRHFVNAPR